MRILHPSCFLWLSSFSFSLLLISAPMSAQQSATWYAELSGARPDQLILRLVDTPNGPAASLDIPGRNMLRLSADSAVLSKKQLFFSFKGLQWTFKGKYRNREWQGLLQTADSSYSLHWQRQPTWPRSQWLHEKPAYREKEVHFENEKAGIRLAGTLTLPKGKGPFPAVVLITGSGPQNRDEEVLGHKPFQVIADALTQAGMAVLRYDDRGVGASEGQFQPATWRDYADDAAAAVAFLKKQPQIAAIGLLGHSEGGNIAPVVATEMEAVDFMLLLAAPGVPNIDMQLKQLDYIVRDTSSGYVYNRDYPFYEKVYRAMAEIEYKQVLLDSLNQMYRRWLTQIPEEELARLGGADAFRESEVERHSTDWYRAFLQFDVQPYLRKLDIPILALNGGRDEQVDAAQNLGALQELLTEGERSADFSLQLLEGLNHFFQPCSNCSILELYFTEVTIAPEALRAIITWLQEQDFID